MRPPGLAGELLRHRLADAYDEWLADAFTQLPETSGMALVAVGGLGRREPAPYSDLDLVLLHTGRQTAVAAELAELLWYPIWDSSVKLDHSVRTPEQALSVARDDLKAMLGQLDLRHIAGDAGLSAPLRERMVDLWRTRASASAAELRELAQTRWRIAGEGAFLLEPNLKDSRGGLRDVRSLYALALAQLADLPAPVRQANADLLDVRGGLRDGLLLRALAIAQLVDLPASAREAYRTLLDVRSELQRRTGRNLDVLFQQEQSGVAEALHLPDADAVLGLANEAARGLDPGCWRRSVRPDRSASRSRTMSSLTTARSFSPATPTPGPTRCSSCGSRAPPPNGTYPSPVSPLSGWPRNRRPCRGPGRRRPPTTSSRPSAPAPARCRCWRVSIRPGCSSA